MLLSDLMTHRFQVVVFNCYFLREMELALERCAITKLEYNAGPGKLVHETNNCSPNPKTQLKLSDV